MNAMSEYLSNLEPQIRRAITIPPHPWGLRVAAENLEFDRAMLSLASCVPSDLRSVTEGFKKFAVTRPQGWRDTVMYCRTHFLERGRFPFEIEEWPEFVG